MNSTNNEITNGRGIILDDNVDMEWLKSITPRLNKEFCKFVINKETNKIAVGMYNHADACSLLGDSENNYANLYGGNIYFKDGSIVYQSTLNVRHNLELNEKKDKKESKIGFLKLVIKKNNNNSNNNNSDDISMRIITDNGLISIINSVLYSWIKL